VSCRYSVLNTFLFGINFLTTTYAPPLIRMSVFLCLVCMCACVVRVQHADARRPTRDDILASFDSKFHASVSEAFPTSFQSMPAQSNMQQFQSMPPQSNMPQRSSYISNQAPYDTRVSDHRLNMKCFPLTHNNPSNPPLLSF